MAPTTAIKTVIQEFIEIYRCHPCLWKIKDKQYHDKGKKEAAYKLLIEKLREIEPTANKDAVVRKINNLRSNVRKEKKKYELSLKSGISADGIYNIKLWYYDLLNFLNDQNIPRKSSSNLDSDDANSREEEISQGYEGSSVDDQVNQNQTHYEWVDNDEDQSASWSTKSTESIVQDEKRANNKSSRPPKQGKAQMIDDTLTNDVLMTVRDHFKTPRPIITPEDRWDIIGKNIAIKLRSLDKKTVLVAEKLINDLLFEAEMENVTPDHADINIRAILKQYQKNPGPMPKFHQHVLSQRFSPYFISTCSSRGASPPSIPSPSHNYYSQPEGSSSNENMTSLPGVNCNPQYLTPNNHQHSHHLSLPIHTTEPPVSPQDNLQSSNLTTQILAATVQTHLQLKEIQKAVPRHTSKILIIFIDLYVISWLTNY